MTRRDVLEILDRLDRSSIRVWLDGGWGRRLGWGNRAWTDLFFDRRLFFSGLLFWFFRGWGFGLGGRRLLRLHFVEFFL